MMEKMQAGDAADGSVPGWGGCELGGLDDWMVGVWGGKLDGWEDVGGFGGWLCRKWGLV